MHAGRSVARNALGRPLPSLSSLSLVILAPYLHNSACNDPAPRHTHTRSTSLHNVLVARRDGSADPFVLREPTRSEAPSPPGNQQTARPGAEMGESSSASSIHWSVDGSYLSTAASHLPLAKPPTTYR